MNHQLKNEPMFNHQMPLFPYGPPAPSTAAASTAQGQKTKSPEHIKRPMNMFMVWSQEERKQITKNHPHKHNAEISQDLAAKWKKMSDAEKAPWKEKADRLKMEHQKKFPGYRYQPKREPKKNKESAKDKAQSKRAAPPMVAIENVPQPESFEVYSQMNTPQLQGFPGFYNPPEIQNQLMMDPQMMMYPYYMPHQMMTNPSMIQNQAPLQMNSPIPHQDYYPNFTNPQPNEPSMYAPPIQNQYDFISGIDYTDYNRASSSGFHSSTSSNSSPELSPMDQTFTKI